MPVEAELISSLGVSRTALREAFRTLAAKGLVVSRKRFGTSVSPIRDWNFLDKDVLTWMDGTEISVDFLHQIIEARQIFEPDAARLAAERASAAEVAEIEKAYQRMTAARRDDIEACIDADLAFHRAILSASHNYVLRSLADVIGAALRTIFRLSTEATDNFQRTLDIHGEVLQAIRLQDGEAAFAHMTRLLRISSQDLKKIRYSIAG